MDDAVRRNTTRFWAVTRKHKNAIPSYEHRKSLEGVSWTLRAYETGRFNVTPLAYWKERGLGIPAAPYWANTFQSELVASSSDDGPGTALTGRRLDVDGLRARSTFH